jgi:hypothetical protein
MNEDNKLIAEFLGYETYEMNGVLNVEYSEDNIRTIQDTHYHIDWNWLMQVVDKIESLGVVVEIRENVCYIETTPNDYYSELETTKIQAVYKACVEFIKWYNEQNFNI